MAGGIISNLMYAVGFKIKTSPLDETDKKIEKLTKTVLGVGAAAAAMAVGIGIAGIHAAADFETAMSKVQSSTGMAASQMQETREIAKDLYSQNFGENWDSLGSAISSVAQITRQTGDALEATTKNALLFEETFGVEVPESARAAKTLMENFGISSDDAFNLMAQGMQKGLDFSGELMDTIDEYSLQFKALGFTANDMFDTLATGAKEGAFNLDKVADAVKEFNIRAKDGNATTIQGFQMLGLNAKKMMETFAAGGPAAKESFSQIVQMIGDIANPVQQNTVAVDLFGTQFEDLQKDVITAMGMVDKQFDMTRGTMDELNKVKFNSPGQAMEMFGRSLQTGLLIPIGEKLLPYLTQFGQWLADHRGQIEAVGSAIGDKLGAGIDAVTDAFHAVVPIVKDIIDRSKEFASMIKDWDGLLPVVVGLAGAYGILRLAVLADTAAKKINLLWTNRGRIANDLMSKSAIVSGAKLIKSWTMVSARAIASGAVYVAQGAIVVGRWIWMGAQSLIQAARMAAAWFIALGPIGWISGAIIGLSVLVIANWDKIRTFTVQIWTTTVNWLSGMWDKVSGKASEIWTGIKDGLASAWSGIKGLFIDGINWVIDKLNSMIDKVNKAMNVKLPDWMGGGDFGFTIPTIPTIDGSHKDGLAKVPWDGYVAELHKGERVLTADENKRYTPESAPARAPSDSAGVMKHEIALKVDFSGAPPAGSIDKTTMAQWKQLLEDTFTSALRRMGLEAATDGDA